MSTAEKMYKTHPDAFLLIFTKVHPYRDEILNNNRCAYRGQNKRTNFDNLLGNNEIEMYIFEQKPRLYKFLGKCISRSCSKRTDKQFPTMHFICKEKPNEFVELEDSIEPNESSKQHKYRRQFLSKNNLKLLSGGYGDGIMLVKKM